MLFHGKGREGDVICNELACLVVGSVHSGHDLRNPLSVGAASAATADFVPVLACLPKTARDSRNVFVALMDAVKTHLLERVSHALYEVF